MAAIVLAVHVHHHATGFHPGRSRLGAISANTAGRQGDEHPEN
jgi:hypothetical protein